MKDTEESYLLSTRGEENTENHKEGKDHHPESFSKRSNRGKEREKKSALWHSIVESLRQEKFSDTSSLTTPDRHTSSPNARLTPPDSPMDHSSSQNLFETLYINIFDCMKGDIPPFFHVSALSHIVRSKGKKSALPPSTHTLAKNCKILWKGSVGILSVLSDRDSFVPAVGLTPFHYSTHLCYGYLDDSFTWSLYSSTIPGKNWRFSCSQIEILTPCSTFYVCRTRKKKKKIHPDSDFIIEIPLEERKSFLHAISGPKVFRQTHFLFPLYDQCGSTTAVALIVKPLVVFCISLAYWRALRSLLYSFKLTKKTVPRLHKDFLHSHGKALRRLHSHEEKENVVGVLRKSCIKRRIAEPIIRYPYEWILDVILAQRALQGGGRREEENHEQTGQELCYHYVWCRESAYVEDLQRKEKTTEKAVLMSCEVDEYKWLLDNGWVPMFLIVDQNKKRLMLSNDISCFFRWEVQCFPGTVQTSSYFPEREEVDEREERLEREEKEEREEREERGEKGERREREVGLRLGNRESHMTILSSVASLLEEKEEKTFSPVSSRRQTNVTRSPQRTMAGLILRKSDLRALQSTEDGSVSIDVESNAIENKEREREEEETKEEERRGGEREGKESGQESSGDAREGKENEERGEEERREEEGDAERKGGENKEEERRGERRSFLSRRVLESCIRKETWDSVSDRMTHETRIVDNYFDGLSEGAQCVRFTSEDEKEEIIRGERRDKGDMRESRGARDDKRHKRAIYAEKGEMLLYRRQEIYEPDAFSCFSFPSHARPVTPYYYYVWHLHVSPSNASPIVLSFLSLSDRERLHWIDKINSLEVL